jgi:hypothetical protein
VQSAEVQVQRYRGTEDRGSEVQRCRGAEGQRCRGAEVQRCRGAEQVQGWCSGAEVVQMRFCRGVLSRCREGAGVQSRCKGAEQSYSYVIWLVREKWVN